MYINLGDGYVAHEMVNKLNIEVIMSYWWGQYFASSLAMQIH